MGLLIQSFEMGNGKRVIIVRVRRMGFGKSLRVRKWMGKRRGKRKEMRMRGEVGFQMRIEMVMIEKRTYMLTRTGVVRLMVKVIGMPTVFDMGLARSHEIGFLLVKQTGIST